MDAPVALVTGGGRGIGRGICLELAAAGYGVCVNYRGSRDGALQTKAECLKRGAPWADAVQADVGNIEDHAKILDEILRQCGRLDVLVNNAGISSPVRGDMLEVSVENWDTVLATNLKGPFFLTQQAARRMIGLRERDVIKRGTIINVSSISAYVASTARSEYCISKAGLSMMTQLFAHRMAEYAVFVYEIRPGIVATDMTSGAKEKYDQMIAEGLAPIRRWGTAEDVGRAAVTLANGGLPFSTGEVVNIDGGYHSPHL